MLELNPLILKKGGKKVFAILPYKEFEQLTEALSDYQDLQHLRSAKAEEEGAPAAPLAARCKKR